MIALRKMLGPLYGPLLKLAFKCFRLIPTSPKYIFFESEIDFAENARALYEYMAENPRYRDYHLIWKVQAPKKYAPRKNTVFVSWDDRLKYHYYLNRCKYFIFTHPYWLTEWKKDQVVINTCHGNNFKAPPMEPLKGVFDYMLANSEDCIRFRRKDFSGDYEIVVLGAPRSDYLLSSQYDRNYLDEFIDTSRFQKIVFCMPTFKKAALWQDGQANNSYSINIVSSQEELYALNEALRERNVLLVCIIHHLQVMDEMITGKLSNIIYLRDEDYAEKGLVMNQMLRCADALVTDFSGVFLDYILLDRPIGFFCNDRDQYTRGFAMENPEDYMPGPHMYTMQDFLTFIDDVCSGEDRYVEFRKTVRDRVHAYQDDKNCQRFLEYFKI